jgi:hypothetical protein
MFPQPSFLAHFPIGTAAPLRFRRSGRFPEAIFAPQMDGSQPSFAFASLSMSNRAACGHFSDSSDFSDFDESSG